MNNSADKRFSSMTNTNSNTQQKQPLAIVGVGCRFPGGVATPKEFWDILQSSTDAIIDVPNDRWDARRFYSSDKDKEGKTTSKQFGFLQSNVLEFDPLFFGISPKEAARMDPQQRLLLQTTWEAFEDAGINEKQIKGSKTGVFMGGFTVDSKLIQCSNLNRHRASPQSSTTFGLTMLSNRISYAFDLKGPSLSIDTACSSSLVALHYACQSIWNNESNWAIAGGANIMLAPDYAVVMSKGKFLSSHSRCKTFDADAQGYVRGEGAGVILVKPLEQARRDNDMIHAVIHQTGINHDGKTNGITVPDGQAQMKLMRHVIDTSGVDPSKIRYLEAHGTGTPIGDPIEFRSLNQVMTDYTTDNPSSLDYGEKVFVGSVKTNIGHLEAASGVAGLLKAALIVKNNQVVPNLHFNKPNPNIVDYKNAKIQVPNKVQSLSSLTERFAMVNSFGYGGTNANVLLSNAINDQEEFHQPDATFLLPWSLLPISAKSEKSLQGYAKKLLHFLKDNNNNNGMKFENILHSLIHRRTHHHGYRAAFLSNSELNLIEQLEQFVNGHVIKNVQSNMTKKSITSVMFVFSGMGPQWFNMGKMLYETNNLFRSLWEEYDKVFQDIAGWSLLDELLKDEEHSRIEETQIAQPGNFFLQAALVEIWKSFGVVPSAVLGHSVGEVTAAYVSGALNLYDALTVSYYRSQTQQKLTGCGAMLAVALSEDEALEVINRGGYNDTVSVAAINSLKAVTLAGNQECLNAISNDLSENHIFNKMLNVDIAYHSPQMDPLKNELLSCLENITPSSNITIPYYSSVTANIEVKETIASALYWWENVRKPVRFASALTEAITSGSYETFLEIGPHPVLRHSIRECMETNNVDGNILFTLRRKENEMNNLLGNVAHFYSLGYDNIKWDRFITKDGKFVRLPTYAWNNEVTYDESPQTREDRLGLPGHPFLNLTHNAKYPTYKMEINDQFVPYLNDHVVEGHVVFPGAGYAEAALALQCKVLGSESCTLTDIEFKNVLVVSGNVAQQLVTSFDTDRKQIDISSVTVADHPKWNDHASVRVLPLSKTQVIVNLISLQKSFDGCDCVTNVYDILSSIELQYGPCFRGISELRRTNDRKELFVTLELDERVTTATEYHLHPCLLDACFQSAIGALDHDQKLQPNAMVPTKIKYLHYYGRQSFECTKYFCHVTIVENTRSYMIADLLIMTESGHVVAEIKELRCQVLNSKQDSVGDTEKVDDLFYDFEWYEKPYEQTTPGLSVLSHDAILFCGYKSSVSNSIVENLQRTGASVTTLYMDDFLHRDGLFDENGLGRELCISMKVNGFSKIIYGCGLESQNSLSYEKIQELTLSFLKLCHALLQKDHRMQLVVLSLLGHKVTTNDRYMNVNLGAMLGLSHVMANEAPYIKPLSIDLDNDALNEPSRWIQELIYESSPIDEDIALRGNMRYVRRLAKPKNAFWEHKDTITIGRNEPFELRHDMQNKFDGFYAVKSSIIDPQDDEITLEVFSAPLNLKDILKVSNALPLEALKNTYFQNNLGLEVCGRVVKVGENIRDLKVGDDIVMAPKGGAFRKYITAKPEFYIKKPKHISFHEFNFVVPFVTAWHGLIDKAELSEGETVLIHNGSGGVGLAAIQIAKRHGANVITTAGTPEKREYLRRVHGIEHVFDSRTLNFASEIRHVTNGRGVDVVLNAIAGESLIQSFELLADYGRFIEIGKQGGNKQNILPLESFDRNASLFHIDLDRLFLQKPKRAQKLLDIMYEKFESEEYETIPFQTFPADRISEAFRFMNESKHIGKVLIDFDLESMTVLQEKQPVKPNGTYLITGGTGGFGFEIAKWLAKNGAHKIMLCVRSAVKDSHIQQVIDDINNNNSPTTIIVAQADVTDTTAITTLIERLKADIDYPLLGIFHAAMVLDDALMKDLDKERFLNVMGPKVLGAINLHNALGDYELDFFVCFSSISALIGNVGQGNYVAANSFLDNFSHWRNAQGLTCTSLNLGVLSEVGVVSRKKDVGQMMDSYGIKGFTTEMALKMLNEVIWHKPAQISYFDVAWDTWAQFFATSSNSSRFSNIVEDSKQAKKKGKDNLPDGLRSLLLKLEGAASHQERLSIVLDVSTKTFAKVMQMTPDQIDINKGMDTMGADSLIAAELGRAMKKSVGVSFSVMDLFSGSTLIQLAEKALSEIDDTIIIANK